MINITEELRCLEARGWRTNLQRSLRVFTDSIVASGSKYGCPAIPTGARERPEHPYHVLYWIATNGKIEIRVCKGKSTWGKTDTVDRNDHYWWTRTTRFSWYAKHIIKRLQKHCDKINNVDRKQLRKHDKMERKLAKITARL